MAGKIECAVAWDIAYLHVHYAGSLEKWHPEAATLLSKVKLTTDLVSAMTFALAVEKMSAADHATLWAKKNAELVESWLR